MSVSKKAQAQQDKIEELVEARFRLQIEMLEKINAALIADNNKLGARIVELERQINNDLGRG